MAIRLSTGLVNKLLTEGSFKSVFSNAVIDIYAGTQPASADQGVATTKLCTVTLGSGAFTAETRGAGTLTLAGSAGSINTVTVNGLDVLGGAVTYTTDMTTTAAAVAAQINANPKNKLFVASAANAIVTLTAVAGLGALVNGWVVAYTATTMTATPANMSAGVDAVNGLLFNGSAAAGVLQKLPVQSWTGTVLAGGVAGWFRLRESTDTGVGDSTAAARYDGSIASSGAQMNMAVQTLVAGAPFIMPAGSITLPMS